MLFNLFNDRFIYRRLDGLKGFFEKAPGAVTGEPVKHVGEGAGELGKAVEHFGSAVRELVGGIAFSTVEVEETLEKVIVEDLAIPVGTLLRGEAEGILQIVADAPRSAFNGKWKAAGDSVLKGIGNIALTPFKAGLNLLKGMVSIPVHVTMGAVRAASHFTGIGVKQEGKSSKAKLKEYGLIPGIRDVGKSLWGFVTSPFGRRMKAKMTERTGTEKLMNINTEKLVKMNTEP